MVPGSSARAAGEPAAGWWGVGFFPSPVAFSNEFDLPGKRYAVRKDQILGGHISSSGVYPANLCPLSCLVELASLAEDFG
jgi:hypothetical protein